MMLLLKEKARKTAPIKKNCRSMLVFSSTASGKSLVTCLIRVFIWIIMNLRALVRKEENATYLCSACYVFLKRAVRICVARLLNFACHLFCPLFVWSMNTMILILPQCVSHFLGIAREYYVVGRKIYFRHIAGAAKYLEMLGWNPETLEFPGGGTVKDQEVW